MKKSVSISSLYLSICILTIVNSGFGAYMKRNKIHCIENHQSENFVTEEEKEVHRPYKGDADLTVVCKENDQFCF